MNYRTLLFFGKAIIACNIIEQVFWQFASTWLFFNIERDYTYWLFFILRIAIGVVMCYIASKKIVISANERENLDAGNMLVKNFFRTIMWTWIVIGCLYSVGLMVYGIWYAFDTFGFDLLGIFLMIGFPVICAIRLGCYVYENYNSKNKKKR